MRILFVSQYYPPETNAPANRVSRLVQEWSAAGADVTVLTGHPNHPEGRVYPGHKTHQLLIERDGGVRLIRVPIYASANRGVFRRSLAFGSFCLSASTLGVLVSGHPDVVVATSPQLLAGVAGSWLSKVPIRRPFVLEVRDLWPDSIAAVRALSESNPAMKLLRGIERRLYHTADHIVVVTESFREILANRGVARDRLSYIPNGVDSDLFSPDLQPDDPVGINDPYPGRFVVCFAGTVGMAHGLDTMLDAARLLESYRDILFLVVGEGAERAQLEARAKANGPANVIFTGRVPRERVAGLLRRADVSLVMLRADPLFRTVLPSKLFESMGCAKPILLGVDGEARRLLNTAGAGVFFRPDDPQALADGLLNLRRDSEARRRMGESGRRYALQHFDRTALARSYLDLLHRITVTTPRTKTV